MRFRAMAWCCALLLTGCAAVPGQLPATYDFGPPVWPADAAPAYRGMALDVSGAGSLQGTGIEYRLAYLDVQQRHRYTLSRWADSPLRLLRSQLTQQLAFASGRAPCLLRLDISEFSQIFQAPERSSGLLQGRAELLDGQRRSLLQRGLRIEVAAPGADASGGVRALTLAVTQLANELGDWLRAAEPACRAG